MHMWMEDYTGGGEKEYKDTYILLLTARYMYVQVKNAVYLVSLLPRSPVDSDRRSLSLLRAPLVSLAVLWMHCPSILEASAVALLVCFLALEAGQAHLEGVHLHPAVVSLSH